MTVMPTRSPRPRRPAKTRLGRGIVDAILDAAAEILADGGYSALTTNHLAERAGVSIGSLYHYFPNKEAVIATLAQRLEERAVELFRQRRDDVPAASDKEAIIRRLSSTLVSDELGAAATRRALLLDVPRRWVEAAGKDREEFVHRQLAGLLEGRDTVRGGDRELMAFVMEHAVRGVVEGALMYRPELFESEALADELAVLLARYTEK